MWWRSRTRSTRLFPVQVCLLLPDVSASTLDTAISLAYRGAVEGLSQQAVSERVEMYPWVILSKVSYVLVSTFPA